MFTLEYISELVLGDRCERVWGSGTRNVTHKQRDTHRDCLRDSTLLQPLASAWVTVKVRQSDQRKKAERSNQCRLEFKNARHRYQGNQCFSFLIVASHQEHHVRAVCRHFPLEQVHQSHNASLSRCRINHAPNPFFTPFVGSAAPCPLQYTPSQGAGSTAAFSSWIIEPSINKFGAADTKRTCFLAPWPYVGSCFTFAFAAATRPYGRR